jgi:uncharacterized protein (TIGR02145 family)
VIYHQNYSSCNSSYQTLNLKQKESKMKTRKIILGIVTVATLATSVYGACTSNVDMGSQKITNLSDPATAQDAATKNYVDDAVARSPGTYEIIEAGEHIWLDRNVGATVVATKWNDTNPAVLGYLFQWGRRADGHEKRTSTTQTERATTDTPDSSKFIVTDEINWRAANVTDLWSVAGSAKNGVCPTGWRVPSQQDFKDIGLEDDPSVFFKKLNLTAAGRRYDGDGSIDNFGTHGNYWTSSVISNKSYYLSIYSRGLSIDISRRGRGFSVRCVK